MTATVEYSHRSRGSQRQGGAGAALWARWYETNSFEQRMRGAYHLTLWPDRGAGPLRKRSGMLPRGDPRGSWLNSGPAGWCIMLPWSLGLRNGSPGLDVESAVGVW